MNSPTDPGSGQPGRQPGAPASKKSPQLTHTLFRLFVVAVLGSFFVFQLDVNYLWLTALLTAAAFALGIVLLVRAVKYKESRLVLFGTISGLVVSAVMLLVILASTLFFTQIRDYQHCVRQALTEQSTSACRTQLQNAMPTQFR
ncbi:hypothetical protein [Arthrobacter oryzae]|uniref:Uncharacterized protein n=1 Tax=Arthrobacter oryzae TaxID=409290 RepID=A0A495EQT3_9MICC|nr:hypothetical protein [Arthrobacter oryzae]RKR19355.1 hypothetical protein C8D78_2100 [Arthrobacter oryzae]